MSISTHLLQDAYVFVRFHSKKHNYLYNTAFDYKYNYASVCLYVPICMYLSTNTNISIYIHTDLFIHLCMDVCMYICLYINRHMCVFYCFSRFEFQLHFYPKKNFFIITYENILVFVYIYIYIYTPKHRSWHHRC
jgi:hypothetical protein